MIILLTKSAMNYFGSYQRKLYNTDLDQGKWKRKSIRKGGTPKEAIIHICIIHSEDCKTDTFILLIDVKGPMARFE